MKDIKSISFIGSGNIATHLARVFKSKGFVINEIFSPTTKNASKLALQVGAKVIGNIKDLNLACDLIIICIKDDKIQEVANQLADYKGTIAHTSGSISISVLNQFNYSGIFYPLQTFSKENNVDFTSIPICIEANNKETEDTLVNLAKCLSENVQLINSEQRKAIHLAAVFACNFSNNMYAIAEAILANNNMDLSILKPLIVETANKINQSSPKHDKKSFRNVRGYERLSRHLSINNRKHY